MKRKSLFVSVVWKYEGNEKIERRRAVEALEYPSFEIVDSFAARSSQCDVCLFWADDGKPVAADFIHRMIAPILSSIGTAIGPAIGSLDGQSRGAGRPYPRKRPADGNPDRAGLHLWSGNALAVPNAMLRLLEPGDLQFTSQSFLRSMLPLLEPAEGEIRIRVALSSVERLAPMILDPLGLPS